MIDTAPFGLLTLIGLDSRRHLVLDVNFIAFDLVAFDPAPRVHQIDIVLVPWAHVDANDLRRSGAIASYSDHDLPLFAHRRPNSHCRRCGGGTSDDCRDCSHCLPPCVGMFSMRMARP